MNPLDLIVYSLVVKLLTDDSAKVRSRSSSKSNRYLQLLELSMAFWFLHLLQDDALLHLSDVLFLNNTHEVLESSIDFVRIKLVTLSDTLAQEVIPPLLGQS